MTLADRTWQDREIRFDISVLSLKPIDGETIICRRSRVEDSKGNTSISGVLMVTNLRIIWHSEKNTRSNISIGNGCVKVITSSMAERKNRETALGMNEVLYIVCRYGEAKFEFIFSSQYQTAIEIYQIAQETMSMYSRTSILRQVRLRSSSIFTDSLVLAPNEEIICFVEGTWNVTAEQGTLGTFYLTRRRAVWIALCNSVYNASIPYMHVQRDEISTRNAQGTDINTIQIDKLVFHEPLGLCFELADNTSIEKAWDEAVKHNLRSNNS
ncbi:Bardet-Biedl syndrome 5 protein-like isoform X2 [Artemia franciscana]|uniref:Bardet-Biedl syndrome 5 protein-like isoform X2 n=1 Tax=Artemia franciscana TaxID=6661 RepID=UPI0032DA5C1E